MTLPDTLFNTPFFRSLATELIAHKSLLFQELWDSPKALIALFAAKKSQRSVLIVTSREGHARLLDDLETLSDIPIYEMPAWEALPGEEIRPSPDIMGKRLGILHTLTEQEGPSILLTPLQSALQLLPSRSTLKQQFWRWSLGDEIPFDEIAPLLRDLGYERQRIATDKGQFALRGGIIDIFPSSSPTPFRIEFFGDTIEKIREYDPMGQKTTREVERVEILPGEEYTLALDEKNPESLLDYLNHPIVIFDDLLALEDKYVALKAMPGIQSKLMLTPDRFFERTSKEKQIFFSQEKIEALSSVDAPKPGRSFYSGKTPTHPLSFEILNRNFNTARMYTPFVSIRDHFELTSNEELYDKIAHIPTSKSLSLYIDNKSDLTYLQSRTTLPQNTQIVPHYLSSGFVFDDQIIIPYTEFTKRFKVRREKWRTTHHTPVSDFHQIEPGDLVVHFNNGVGKYLGIEKQRNHLGIDAEFLLIEYASRSKLYVPMSQSHLVSRYIGTDESLPTLHELGTNKWQRAKASAQKAIVGYAKDLLATAAERELRGGHVYANDSDIFTAFEEAFPYTETEDQRAAIEAIKKEMTSDQAMDRLVCGDVGYGKTEVAMRAAFKAVVDGNKQVAVLVPTTVLALQHYENFSARMEDYPVRIAHVSRFCKPKQIKETLEKTARGEIDILIGTHRLVSPDVNFKDLGLVIIDEEQRFGVRAKEKLKKLKVNVDCLTLTATPIPRTLYFSLINAREMSVINSPPQDRLPIKTILAEDDDTLIQNAFLRELARDGQGFYIHNRVESIYKAVERLQKLLPAAQIQAVHGQMDADAIDNIFHAFKSGDIDILVATSIIENGIDIPNANTIIVEKAHAFGMSDLYQIRGRVGRWTRSAYAYFLTPKNQVLPEISQKRLSALVEASGYGGGMKLAMRDLEIRGAGDILGVQQSGHVCSIGFHLYCKLLKKAVKALKQNLTTDLLETKMEFTFDATLPHSYINDETLRFEIYHRIGELATFDECNDLFNELIDRFGPLPKGARLLYHMTRLRLFASQNQLLSLTFIPNGIRVEKQASPKPLRKTLLLPKDLTPFELEQLVIMRLTTEFDLPPTPLPPPLPE